jgi:hypothetical protein
MFLMIFVSGRAALNDTVITVKENCLTNLQNVLARDYAIWYFPALYFAA